MRWNNDRRRTPTWADQMLWLQAENNYLLRRIMSAVQIQQEDLDGFADQLGALVTAVNEIDLTVLPEADQTRLISGITDLAAAVNSKAFPTTEPEPVPEPSPTPEPVEPPVDEAPAPE